MKKIIWFMLVALMPALCVVRSAHCHDPRAFEGFPLIPRIVPESVESYEWLDIDSDEEPEIDEEFVILISSDGFDLVVSTEDSAILENLIEDLGKEAVKAGVEVPYPKEILEVLFEGEHALARLAPDWKNVSLLHALKFANMDAKTVYNLLRAAVLLEMDESVLDRLGQMIYERIYNLRDPINLADVIRELPIEWLEHHVLGGYFNPSNLLYNFIEQGKVSIPVIQALIDRGANVNIQRIWTPLQLAAKRGNLKLVKLLLGAGADVNIGDKAGRTALIFAGKEGHKDVAQLLRDAGAAEGYRYPFPVPTYTPTFPAEAASIDDEFFSVSDQL